MNKIDGLKFKEMLAGGARALEINRSTIDKLNVFPVPDGDTGTNMHLTIASAMREVNASGSLLVDEIAKAFSSGALRGARGNSGVITSQIFNGFSHSLEGKAYITPKIFAECLKRGSQIAYGAVMKPKEGTILTVIRIMAEEAESAARGKRVEFESFLARVIEAGENVLQKTPEMLPVLKKAGVVDAGGRGLLTIFDGMYRTLVGEELVLLSGESVTVEPATAPALDSSDMLENDYEHITFQYCTEFFITHLKNEVTTTAIDKYREYLATIGDCVLVIGSPDLVKTHVHTNNPDRALNAALALGELDDVKIENMVEQHRRLHPEEEKSKAAEKKEYALISVCAGDGMRDIFTDLGVDITVSGGQTMNPSVDDILEAVNRASARNVFVLPNNSNIILAAEQAKALAKVNVLVVPTNDMPQGIAATLAFDSEASLGDNMDNMCDAITGVCTAEITHAVRSARMNGYTVREGDIIGINAGKIIAKNSTVAHVMNGVLKKLSSGKQMCTLYYGEDVSKNEAEALTASLGELYPDLEIACYYGGQPHYYYIISLE